MILRRLLGAFATLLLASITIFLALEILPGDPAQIILGTGAQEDTLAALRSQMGLDRPLVERYISWVAGMLVGDFKNSYTYGIPVTELISQRISISLPLALFAIILAIAIALPCGVVSAARRGRLSDTLISAGTQIGIAIPNFWFAILLILLFAVHLRWLPSGGFPGWTDGGIGASLIALLLPAIALALPQAAILTRVTRGAMLEVLQEHYMRTASAKGLSPTVSLWTHGLQNALIPVVTILGLQFSFLLAGTIIIENVFYLPGIGRLLFQAIAQRDIVVVQNLVMLIVATVITINLVVDLAAIGIDPRLRRQDFARG